MFSSYNACSPSTTAMLTSPWPLLIYAVSRCHCNTIITVTYTVHLRHLVRPFHTSKSNQKNIGDQQTNCLICVTGKLLTFLLGPSLSVDSRFCSIRSGRKFIMRNQHPGRSPSLLQRCYNAADLRPDNRCFPS